MHFYRTIFVRLNGQWPYFSNVVPKFLCSRKFVELKSVIIRSSPHKIQQFYLFQCKCTNQPSTKNSQNWTIEPILIDRHWLQKRKTQLIKSFPNFVFHYKNFKIVKTNLYMCVAYSHVVLLIFEFCEWKCHFKHLHHFIIYFRFYARYNAGKSMYIPILYAYYSNANINIYIFRVCWMFQRLNLPCYLCMNCVSAFNSNKMSLIIKMFCHLIVKARLLY